MNNQVHRYLVKNRMFDIIDEYNKNGKLSSQKWNLLFNMAKSIRVKFDIKIKDD